jgi:uncharacterized protein (DUF1015 family)
MAIINPFKGWYFDPKKVNLDDIIIPPYDIISDQERTEYKLRSPYNMVHGTLSDGDEKTRYTNAKKYLDSVTGKEILIQDKEECFYIVEQTVVETEKKRVFFLAGVDLTEYKKMILPHERTFEEPKRDRKLLLKAIKANIEIPFVLYSDLHRLISGMFEFIMKGQPLLRFTDPNEVSYAVWRLSDKKLIKDIQDIMKTKKLYIADGHHRIESGYDVMRESGNKKYAKSMMMALSNYNDEEKCVLPTHRLVYGLNKLDIQKFERDLTSTYFDLHIFQYDATNEEIQLEKMKGMMQESEFNNVIGMYYPANKRYYAITPKDTRKISQWVEEQKAEFKNSSVIKKQLDVTWLHSLILKPYLEIDTVGRHQKNLSFVKGTHEDAIKAMAKDKKYQLIFFLNPTTINDIIAIADEHDTVPQKTTYFFPKVDSGVIIQKLV